MQTISICSIGHGDMISKFHYKSDKLCKHGHFLRYIQSKKCVTCNEIQRRKNKEQKDYLHSSRWTPTEEDTSLRAVARRAGKVAYKAATSCKRGHYRRYTITDRCKLCSDLYFENRTNRLIAEKNGVEYRNGKPMYYIGQVCKECGESKKYLSNMSCVNCQRRENKRRRDEKRAVK